MSLFRPFQASRGEHSDARPELVEVARPLHPSVGHRRCAPHSDLRAWLALLLALAACTTPDLRREHADGLAHAAGWHSERLIARDFTVTAYLPDAPAHSTTLTIYIEGDGLAWLSETQPSDDPTPRCALALELALRQPADAAAYLARPCQYVLGADRHGCRAAYWTDARFAPEIVAALDEATTQLKQHVQAQRLLLVGYSGGGGLAALVAARRDDVAGLITVAGNLDHSTWTRTQHVSPMPASLNPADAWERLQRLPQVHFIGQADTVVGAAVAQAYRARFPDAAPLWLVVEPGFDHVHGWIEAWPRLWEQAMGRMR